MSVVRQSIHVLLVGGREHPHLQGTWGPSLLSSQRPVIATEGQKVNIDFDAGIVYVDDVALDEPYTLTPTTLHEGVSFPLTVDKGCVFVLGDNRDESKDSRSPEIGLIDCREILGKAIFVLFPGDDDGDIQRDLSRIGVIS